MIYLISTLDKRVIERIKREGDIRGFDILTIRDTMISDGKNPYKENDIWLGVSSIILGISGERTYNKIVIVKIKKQSIKYWVKVKSTFFIPLEVDWLKLYA